MLPLRIEDEITEYSNYSMLLTNIAPIIRWIDIDSMIHVINESS
jgi:hypothetical protein